MACSPHWPLPTATLAPPLLPDGDGTGTSGPGMSRDHLGCYELGRVLGSGGFGVVREATEVASGERVAIKVVTKAQITDDMMARVRNEVQLHSRLSHPAIVGVRSFFEDDEHIYLVMELCAGGELQQRVRQRPLREPEAARLFTQLVHGLLYLHTHGERAS
jgi:polo-like kinase 4